MPRVTGRSGRQPAGTGTPQTSHKKKVASGGMTMATAASASAAGGCGSLSPPATRAAARRASSPAAAAAAAPAAPAKKSHKKKVAAGDEAAAAVQPARSSTRARSRSRSRPASPEAAPAASDVSRSDRTPPPKKSHKKKAAQLPAATAAESTMSGATKHTGASGSVRIRSSTDAPPTAAAASRTPAASVASVAHVKKGHKSKAALPPVPAFTEGSPVVPRALPSAAAVAAQAQGQAPAASAADPSALASGSELPRPLAFSATVAAGAALPHPQPRAVVLRDSSLSALLALPSPAPLAIRQQSAPSAMSSSAAAALQPAPPQPQRPVQAIAAVGATPLQNLAETTKDHAPTERAEPQLQDSAPQLSLPDLQLSLANIAEAAHGATQQQDGARPKAAAALDGRRRRLLVVAVLQAQESLPPYAPRRALMPDLRVTHKQMQTGGILTRSGKNEQDGEMLTASGRSAALPPAALAQLQGRVALWQRTACGIGQPLQSESLQASPPVFAFEQWQRDELARQRLEAASEAAADLAELPPEAADEVQLLLAPPEVPPLIQIAEDEDEGHEKEGEVAMVQTATVEVMPSPSAESAMDEATAAIAPAATAAAAAATSSPPPLPPSPSTPVEPPSKKGRTAPMAVDAARQQSEALRRAKSRQEDDLLLLERQLLAQPFAISAQMQPSPAVAAAPPAAAPVAAVIPAAAVPSYPEGTFLPARVILVPPSAESLDVHRALYAALQAADTFPALLRGRVITADQTTLQAWAPCRLLHLAAAKWKHVGSAARMKGEAHQSDLRGAQLAYRDLQALYYCCCVSFQLLHGGAAAAHFFHARMMQLLPWTRVMASGGGGAAAAASRLDRLRPVGALLQQLSDAVLDECALDDSPKVRALLGLLLRGRWLRRWQQNRKEIAAAVTANAEGSFRSGSHAASARGGALPLPPVRHVTVLVVQSEVMARALSAFLRDRIDVALIQPPEPPAVSASPPAREAFAAAQKADLDPETFLRLFSQHAVVVGRASHLLPHPTFPWSAVSALVHYDCLDPFLFWNSDGGREFRPAARLVELIRQGAVESFSLEIDTSSSFVLLPPEERLLQQLRLPVAAPLRLMAQREWMHMHDDVVFGLHHAQVELEARDLPLPVAVVLDAQAACVVLELADLLHAPEEEVDAHKELISNQMLLLGGHFRRLFVFLYDPALPLPPGSAAASQYAQAQQSVLSALGDALGESALGPVAWSARRVRSAESMMLQLLRAVRVAQEEATAKATAAAAAKASQSSNGGTPQGVTASPSAASGLAWYDRSWLQPYSSPAEHFLGRLPGCNHHIAALFLGRGRMTVSRVLQLTEQEAHELAPEADPAQLVSRGGPAAGITELRQNESRLLTFARTMVRQPPPRVPASEVAAPPILTPASSPQDPLQQQSADSSLFAPQSRPELTPAPLGTTPLLTAPDQLPIQPQPPRKRSHGTMALAQRRARDANEFDEQQGPVQEFASPPSRRAVMPEVTPFSRQRGAPTPSSQPPQSFGPALAPVAHQAHLRTPAHSGPQQHRARPPSSSSSHSSRAAERLPGVTELSGRPPSVSQLLESNRHESSSTVTSGSVTRKRSRDEQANMREDGAGADYGAAGGRGPEHGEFDSPRTQLQMQMRKQFEHDEHEDDEDEDEDAPIGSLLAPAPAQHSQQQPHLWSTPRAPLSSLSRLAPAPQSGPRAPISPPRPQLSRPGSASSQRTLAAASEEHRRLVEQHRGKKSRVGFGQPEDPALRRQRQNVLNFRFEPLSPQQQQQQMEPDSPPHQQLYQQRFDADTSRGLDYDDEHSAHDSQAPTGHPYPYALVPYRDGPQQQHHDRAAINADGPAEAAAPRFLPRALSASSYSGAAGRPGSSLSARPLTAGSRASARPRSPPSAFPRFSASHPAAAHGSDLADLDGELEEESVEEPAGAVGQGQGRPQGCGRAYARGSIGPRAPSQLQLSPPPQQPSRHAQGPANDLQLDRYCYARARSRSPQQAHTAPRAQLGWPRDPQPKQMHAHTIPTRTPIARPSWRDDGPDRAGRH